MSQYPDTISITLKPEFEQDDNHNFKPVGEGLTFKSECRAKEIEGNPEVTGADGNIVVVRWIIYMPRTTEVFSFGDEVVILKDEREYKATFKLQSTGQFNTRLWV